jgi:hypothetical protein
MVHEHGYRRTLLDMTCMARREAKDPVSHHNIAINGNTEATLTRIEAKNIAKALRPVHKTMRV